MTGTRDASTRVGGPCFRRAEAADAPTVVALVESAYRGESSRAGWTTEADLLHGRRTDEALVGEIIDAPDSVLLLRMSEGSVLACCQLERRDDRAYFGLFAVSPTSQGNGIGKQLIAYAETYAADQWRSTRMEMTVIRQRTDLIAFYERRGYRDTGIRSPFPYGDERFGEPQREDLEFTLLEKELAIG